MTCDIGLIGLAVMGQNLALNIADHGYKIVVFNRTVDKVTQFLQKARHPNLNGAMDLVQFVKELKRPRKILIMVKAGEAVDACIEQLMPHLEAGDILIDGGNSLYTDTSRREVALNAKGILFVGAGISGGEEGARYGPSIMPGGNEKAWPEIKEILQKIAAKADDGAPCCQWVGKGGSGHFVKMVHNGIEYGDMELIAEFYDLFHRGLAQKNDAIARLFAEWNRGELSSYLIEITAKILNRLDSLEKDGSFLVDKILDVAGQKGTGKWTVSNALDLGVPLTLISEAVFQRFLSSFKEDRQKAFVLFQTTRKATLPKDLPAMSAAALFAAKIMSYTQGFMMLSEANREFGWNMDLGEIALLWRGGCIIRSQFLGNIKEAFSSKNPPSNLLFDPYFTTQIKRCEPALREVVKFGIDLGIPMPSAASALSFFDGFRSHTLPANLIQAQRDFFGAHTYERIDKPRGTFVHTEWE